MDQIKRTGVMCVGARNQDVVDYARAFHWSAAQLAQCFNGMPLEVAQLLLNRKADFNNNIVELVPYHKYARRYVLCMVIALLKPTSTYRHDKCDIPNVPYGYSIKDSAFSAMAFL